MLAQLPSPTASELGVWIVGAVAVLAIAYYIAGLAKLCKELFLKAEPVVLQPAPVPPAYARHEDLVKLEAYTHQSVHELRNALNLVQLKIVEMREVIGREMAANSEKVVRELAKLSGLMEQGDRVFSIWRGGQGEAIEHAVERVMEARKQAEKAG